MKDSAWETSITKIAPNKIQLRGYPIDELMGKVTYTQSIYLAIKGELPSQNVGKLIEAILVSSIDHGVTPPSTLSARSVASTGASLSAAVAAGILAINQFHGGAIEGCMKALTDGVKIKEEQDFSETKAAITLLDNLKNRKQRMPGFGHRIHTADPRTKKLYNLAENLNLAGKFVSFSKVVEVVLEEQIGKKLPINVDGAIAALLCDLDFPPRLGNAFFIMARIPGLIAHVIEEQTQQKPMRMINPTNYEYTGYKERKIK